MTETLLVTMPIVMLIAAMLQIFLIDEYTYRLATQAHAQLFMREAFPNNRPAVPYSNRVVATWQGRWEYVPVVGYFQMYGLSPADLRIRSSSGGYKSIKLGRGTKPDIGAGLEGLADPSALLGTVGAAMDDLQRANRLRDQLNRDRAVRRP